MKWETPSFVEIGMSAEIGGYQGWEERDDGEREAPQCEPSDTEARAD
jgi:hypothetical protein